LGLFLPPALHLHGPSNRLGGWKLRSLARRVLARTLSLPPAEHRQAPRHPRPRTRDAGRVGRPSCRGVNRPQAQAPDRNRPQRRPHWISLIGRGPASTVTSDADPLVVARAQVPNVALAGKMVADGVDPAAVVDGCYIVLPGLAVHSHGAFASDDRRARCGTQLEVLEKPLAGLDSVSADGAGAVGAGEEVMIYGFMLERLASLEAEIHVLPLPTSLAR
jgi:hypothetical protein